MQNVPLSAFDGDLSDQFLEVLVDVAVQTFDDGWVERRVIASHLIDDFAKFQFGYNIFRKGNVDELQNLLIVFDPLYPYFGIRDERVTLLLWFDGDQILSALPDGLGEDVDHFCYWGHVAFQEDLFGDALGENAEVVASEDGTVLED